ncbi:glutaredoxin 2 [Marinomonas pollencensis]|uniref:Glutaredoxin 2 n=1 Tax=Marinomonas pollencensis TaxID=491954 RepID=A0A3E0DAF4_9GAMM|nr:glutaredoxin 2 [Marinomonas pollencensis]REG79554.1 glutaredoxin 2 [Marinomonas pollencensis]
MKLYIYQHCPFCARVRYVAATLGIRLEEIIVDYSDNTSINQIIGKKIVPLLIKENGEPMTESNDIIQYLMSLQATTYTAPLAGTADWQSRAFPLLQAIGYPRWAELDLGEFQSPASKALWKDKKQTPELNFERLIEHTDEIVSQVNLLVIDAEKALQLSAGESALVLTDQAIYFSILRGFYSEASVTWPPHLDAWLHQQSARLSIPLLR